MNYESSLQRANLEETDLLLAEERGWSKYIPSRVASFSTLAKYFLGKMISIEGVLIYPFFLPYTYGNI